LHDFGLGRIEVFRHHLLMVSTTILGALGLQLKNIAAGVRKAIVSTRQPAATLCCLPSVDLGQA
jgi:hypothetical protein